MLSVAKVVMGLFLWGLVMLILFVAVIFAVMFFDWLI